jgi:hypothetical protein
MAVVFMMDFAGGSADDYDWVMEQMALGGRPPAHALFHAAGAHETGWRVWDVWETADAFERFAKEKIGPLTSQRGMPEPAIRRLDVAEVRRGAEAPITFMQFLGLPGLDAEGFAALDRQVVGAERTAPDGCVFHVNGAMGDDWFVLDGWTDKGVRDRFLDEHVRPVMQDKGMAPTESQELAVHNTLITPAGHPAGV